jgi:hypothetical protein
VLARVESGLRPGARHEQVLHDHVERVRPRRQVVAAVVGHDGQARVLEHASVRVREVRPRGLDHVGHDLQRHRVLERMVEARRPR